MASTRTSTTRHVPNLYAVWVVTQLVGPARTGEWLRTDQVVESARVWLTPNAADCDWFERLELMRMSAGLARQFSGAPVGQDEETQAQLFTRYGG